MSNFDPALNLVSFADFAQRNFANNSADSKTVAVRHSDIAENYLVAPDLDIADFAQQEIAHFEQNRSKNHRNSAVEDTDFEDNY